jgi:hypothetical protein
MKKKGEFESLGMSPFYSWRGTPIILWPNRLILGKYGSENG